MRNSELTDLIVHLYGMSGQGMYAPLLIWGEAGIGKSETVKAAAEKLDIDFVDLRLGNLEATDLMGLMRDEVVYPCALHLEQGTLDAIKMGERFTASGLWHHVQIHHRDQIPKKFESDPIGFVEWNKNQLEKMGYGSLIETRTVYSAPAWFPAPDTSGILFLDEMNRSQHETRQGVFQLVLDRRIHELELPPGWILVSANNPPSSTTSSGLATYDVDELDDKAFLNRFAHVVLDASATEWADYARAAGIDATIRTLLSPASEGDERVRKLLGLRSAETPDLEPTPRGWTMLGRILSASEEDPFRSASMLAELVRGIVGINVHTSESTDRNPVTIPIAKDFLEFWEKRYSDPRFQIETLVDMAKASDPKFPKAYQKFADEHRNGQPDLLSKLDDALDQVKIARTPASLQLSTQEEPEGFGAWFQNQLEGRRVT